MFSLLYFVASFLKNEKRSLKKLEYRYLVERTTIENTLLSYKNRKSKSQCKDK